MDVEDVEESRNKSAMASLIESIDHQLDAREMNKVNNDAAHQAETSERRSISSPTTSTFMQRPIKTESYADNYDDMNFIRSLSHSNIDKSITGLDVSAMTEVDTSKHIPFNHRRSLGTTDQECANTSLDSPPGLSPIPIHTGAYSIDRFLNATEFYSDETEWNKWQQNETTQKQNSVDAMAQKYTHVYSEAFLQNESIPEVLGLIYADQGRGLLRYSYRMWSLNRLEIDPLKEVTCRLNWSLVVPSCLQNDANEDARIKNALRKYISNHIYNCRQTIVVRENRDELNRIKMLNLNKELLREAISRIVNKTSDEHGWTLYRPIPSYIMRNISGVRNKAYKQNKDLERVINEEVTTIFNRTHKISTHFSIAEGNEMNYERAMREVFIRGSTRLIRDDYRDWAVATLAVKDWLRLDLKRIDFTHVIPKILKTDEFVYKRVQTRLIEYMYNFIRKARFKLLHERYRHQLLWIRQKYTRDTVPDEVIIGFLERASSENHWEGNIPSFLGTKSWIFKRTIEYFRAKPNYNSPTPLNDDELENDLEETSSDKCTNNSNNNNTNDNSNEKCDNGSPSSSRNESVVNKNDSEAIRAAKFEMFDSSRQLRASYRRYAIDKLDIRSKAVQKGEQLGDDKLDYRSILPEILRNDDAILDKVKRYLHKHILSIKGKQRPQFIIRHKANEFAQLRRQYPTSKDCPRERVKMIINDVYKEQQWDNPPPSAEGFISSFLYNYSLAFIRTLAESLPGQELTEEKCSEESLNDEESMSDISSSVSQLTTPTPDLNATNKTYPRRSERFYRKRTTADDSTNDNDTTNNNDDTNNDNSDPSSSDIKRKRILQDAEGNENESTVTEKVDAKTENERLNEVLKGLFERDMNGPLNSFYRKRVVEEMGISMTFNGNLEELNYDRVIPEQIRMRKGIHNKVKQQIITYLIGYIRRTRLTYIAEEYAPELVDILHKYPKHNSVPLNLLYQIINRIAVKQQWKRYLPLASKLKYRIYERRELIIKRAANNIQLNQHLTLQKQLLTVSGDNNNDSDSNSNDNKIPIASATAIVNTGSLVSPTQATIATTSATTTDTPNTVQSNSLFERNGNSLSKCDTEEGQTAVSSTTYALPSSLLPCSSKTNATDIGQGPSDAKSSTFMETMKTKLKDLNADEMNQLMHRINEHVRNKIVTQLASQIVQNFDVNQHDSMFNEILSIVDKHNKTI